MNLLRALLIQSLLAQAFHCPLGERPPVYVVLDEAEHLLERDPGVIYTILNEGRSLGIHLILIFHTLAQVAKKNPALLASVLENCRTKFLGGHLYQEDLKILTEEFFIDEWHPYIIKDEIRGLEIEPVEEVRAHVSLSRGEQESFTRTLGVSFGAAIARGMTRQLSTTTGKTDSLSQGGSRSRSRTNLRGESTSEGTGLGEVFGTVLNAEGEPLTTSSTSSEIHTSGRSSSRSTGETEGESESWSTSKSFLNQITRGIAESLSSTASRGISASHGATVGSSRQQGISFVPFYAQKKRIRVMNRQFLSLQEFLTEKLIKLKAQPRAHWAVKPPEGQAQFFKAVYVKPLLAAKERLATFRERVFSRPWYQPFEASPSQVLEERIESNLISTSDEEERWHSD